MKHALPAENRVDWISMDVTSIFQEYDQVLMK